MLIHTTIVKRFQLRTASGWVNLKKVTNNPAGALELRSVSKTMVLPKVANPHLNIPSPVTGTLVYDTVSQSVALFDGAVWNYLVAE